MTEQWIVFVGYQLKLEMTVFFAIEFEGEADIVSVLHALVDVVAPTKIIEIFTVQIHIASLNVFY